MTWELSRTEGKSGTGNWEAFPKERLPELFAAVADWRDALEGIERPWLCWCLDDDWCYTQQRLVRQVGWTPVVGTDGAVAQPRLAPGAVFVDFNRRLKLPLMWMHFVLDFVHLTTARLAFWHSDVLPPVPVMRSLANQFDGLDDGELVAVRIKPSLLQSLRRLRKGKPPFYRRFGELTGCITAGASRALYECGCGWWRNPHCHPNARPEIIRAQPHWEHGVGIALWERHFGGPVRELSVDMTPYHYSTHQLGYRRRRDAGRKIEDSKRIELCRSFDLQAIIARLGLPADT